MKSTYRFILILSVSAVFAFGSAQTRHARLIASESLPTPRLALQPCQLPNVEGEARCGKYEVYENRAAKSGRKIALNIVVLKALSPDPAPDPVFWLHGGPGAAATDTVPGARFGYLAEIRKHRDLVFVDQRGTGASNSLRCNIGDDPGDLKSFFGDLLPRAQVRQCREQLEKIADLKLYTTPIAMDDLDEVRDALGYDKINLVAASYGTIAAQVYMRQHADHVRAVLLGGVANPQIKQPLYFARGAQHSLERLFEDCAADKDCAHNFPDLQKEFTAVMARFDKGPVTAELLNPSTKQKETVNIPRGNFVEQLRVMLYTAPGASFVPLLIHQTYLNDYLTFEALAMRFSLGRIISRGMYLTVTCSESVPFITEEEIARETRGTFVGQYRVRVHQEACKEWVKGEVPKNYTELVTSPLPVLLVSGDLDASTPIWLGEDVVQHLSNGAQLKIRYYGHQIDGECVSHLTSQFIEKGTIKGLDTSCTEKIRRPPFLTELPKQFALQ